ncbi:hypothetical protein GTA08_BOTSDO08445 [Neofusicoccum parvum]|uniref:Uncharacterized protein n=1 Tax=Neofusicoccum parvum TaxID=310453 RepID=A0ACB5SNZ4_9PEZI|nr:hypothetical protein GTA08_BOTSDO08445 [Neofusicoccum parvum]
MVFLSSNNTASNSSRSSSPSKKPKISLPRKSFPAPLTRLKFIPQRTTAPGAHLPASLAQAGPHHNTPIKMPSPPKISVTAAPLTLAAASGPRKLRLLNTSSANLLTPSPSPTSTRPLPRLPLRALALSPACRTSVLPTGSPVKKPAVGRERDLSTPELISAFPSPPKRAAPAPPAAAYLPAGALRVSSAPVQRGGGDVVNFSRPLPRRGRGVPWPRRSSSLPVGPAGPVGVAVSGPWEHVEAEVLVAFEDERGMLDTGRGWGCAAWPLVDKAARFEKPLPPLPVDA